MLCFFVLVVTITAVTAVSLENGSIYESLRVHGLPIGLFPKGVTDFFIDETGWFEVHLEQDCNAKFESELHYDRNVSGTLSFGRIGSLSGISAQELFLWFPVKGILVDVPSSGLIYFDVGVVFKQFTISMFETPRECMAVKDEESHKGLHGDLRHVLDQDYSKRDSLDGELRYAADQVVFTAIPSGPFKWKKAADDKLLYNNWSYCINYHESGGNNLVRVFH